VPSYAFTWVLSPSDGFTILLRWGRRITQMSDFLLHTTVSNGSLDALSAYSSKCLE
jgi:hypothetical protein